MAGSGSLTVVDRSAPSGTHVCAFFSRPADRYPYHIDPGEFIRGPE
jgi:hypothetical protein